MITVQDALDVIDHVVDVAGEDHRARNCYIDQPTRQKICLVGRALFVMGMTDEQIIGLGNHSIRSLWVEGRLPIELSVGAMAVLRAAQSAQDGYDEAGTRKTWGQAREAAHRAARKYLEIIPDNAFKSVIPVENTTEDRVLVGV